MGRFVLSVSAAAMVMLCVVAASGQGQPAKDGEAIMNSACGSCHDTTLILTAARSEQQWKDTIDQMISRGASVSDADRPVLVAYLVKAHGPMPDGPGKDIVLNTCTICHDLSRIKSIRHTKQEWEETLVAMLNEGAPLSDENFPIVLNYLAKNFGVN